MGSLLLLFLFLVIVLGSIYRILVVFRLRVFFLWQLVYLIYYFDSLYLRYSEDFLGIFGQLRIWYGIYSLCDILLFGHKWNRYFYILHLELGILCFGYSRWCVLIYSFWFRLGILLSLVSFVILSVIFVLSCWLGKILDLFRLMVPRGSVYRD